MNELTYSPVGGTRTGLRPPGFRHLSYRVFLGSGEDLYLRAAEAVLSFAMHRATGASVAVTAPVAVPGAHVTVGFGPLHAPCEVIWTEKSGQKSGFAYGTLHGHPAAGEEAFVVTLEPHDRVWFTVTAYSRPAGLLMRLGGPFAIVFQHAYARLCGRALKRLCTVNA
ncbi:DUF1990 family protein [Actinoplanes sp. NPDC051513]|uniref:DUF1990 family protein n=1 Tax=Actinoplanes sp. NPDC051513 TaxID=3363908 RepID=UPI0037A9A82E